MRKLCKSIWLIVLVVVCVAAVVALAILAAPYVRLLMEPGVQDRLRIWADSMGAWGWLAILGVQILQVIIAFIPGEPVEIVAGALYGGLGGLLICLAGTVIASSVVFLLSKKLGRPLATKLFGKKNIEKFAFIKDARRLEMIVFILFLIPGTPKDMLTYIVGISRMKLPQFLLISTLARIPSVVSSTFIGSTALRGNWGVMAVIFALTAVVGILGIVFRDRVVDFCRMIARKIKTIKDQ